MRFLLLRFLWAIIAAGIPAFSAQYYVDYASGDDAAKGTSKTAAWKHSPGDKNATAISKSAMLHPGDSVYFKGGVVYRGAINVGWSGVEGARISFIGNEWGSEPAILDGTEPILTRWNRCTNSQEALGNPFWSNIWVTSLPDTISNSLPQLVANGRDLCPWAQDPNPVDPQFWNVLGEWRTVSAVNISPGAIRDSGYFTQPDGFWDEAFAGLWVQGNATVVTPITNYSRALSTIFFENKSETYKDRSSYYVTIGHPIHIDRPGEFAVKRSKNRIFLWPPNSADPNGMSFGFGHQRNAFYLRNVRDIEIRGFKAFGYYHPPGVNGYGGAFVQSTGDFPRSSNVAVVDNEASLMRSFTGSPIILVGSGTNCLVASNYVHDSLISRGIWMVRGSDSTIFSNAVKRINGTALYFGGVTNSSILSNSVTDVIGVHANGLSIYQKSENITVGYNTLSNVYTVITTEFSSNIVFFNNIVDCAGGAGDNKIASWGGHYGPIQFYHNTIIGNPNGNSLYLGANTSPEGVYTLTNNIIAGLYHDSGALIRRGFNLYTKLSWQQSIDTLALGEIYYPTVRSLFEDGLRFHLRGDAPAVNAGVIMPHLDRDFNGVSRRATGGHDLGAIEYNPATLSVEPPTGLRLLN